MAAAVGEDSPEPHVALPVLGESIQGSAIEWLDEPVAGAAEALKAQMAKGGLPAEDIATKVLKTDKTRVLAGSAVLHAVLVARGEAPSWEPGDFDMFCVGADPGLGAIGLMALLSTEDSKPFYTAPGSAHHHKITEYTTLASGKILQAICHEKSEHGDDEYNPPDALYQVADFDFDILKMYFDGENVWMSKEAAAALEGRVLGIPKVVTMLPSSFGRFLSRVGKYLSRGFGSPPERVVFPFAIRIKEELLQTLSVASPRLYCLEEGDEGVNFRLAQPTKSAAKR